MNISHKGKSDNNSHSSTGGDSDATTMDQITTPSASPQADFTDKPFHILRFGDPQISENIVSYTSNAIPRTASVSYAKSVAGSVSHPGDSPLQHVRSYSKVSGSFPVYMDSSQYQFQEGLEATSGSIVYKPSLRERVRLYLQTNTHILETMEIINAVLSLTACMLYLMDVYDLSLTRTLSVWIINLSLNIYFLLDFIVISISKDDLPRYLGSFFGVIDIITVFPPLMVSLLQPYGGDWSANNLMALRVLRVFTALRILRLFKTVSADSGSRDKALQQVVVSLFALFAVVFGISGLFQAFEQPYYEENGDDLYFHDAVYFMLVTVATIGYGDITPKTTYGKILVIFLICGIITILPTMLTRLIALAHVGEVWDGSYKARRKKDTHVVVCGSISAESLSGFLEEFRSLSRGINKVQVVILNPTLPSREIKMLLKKQQGLKYLRGSCAIEKDLRRCKLESAKAVFVLADIYAANREEQDAKTIVRTMAIRKYVERTEACALIYVQLLQVDNRAMVSSVLGDVLPVFTSHLKQSILARGTASVGCIALISNLLRTHETESLLKKHRELKKEVLASPWLPEYLHGLCHEIYPIVLTDAFENDRYGDAAEILFTMFGAILLGVNQYNPKDRRFEIFLGAIDHVLHAGDTAFVIARSAIAAHEISVLYSQARGMQKSGGAMLPHVDASQHHQIQSIRGGKSWLVVNGQPKLARSHRDLNRSVSQDDQIHQLEEFHSMRLKALKDHTPKNKLTAFIEEVEHEMDAHEEHFDHEEKADDEEQAETLFVWNTEFTKENLRASLKKQTRDHVVGIFEEHIVILGTSSLLQQYVHALRQANSLLTSSSSSSHRKGEPKEVPIVILSEKPPSLDLWSLMGCPQDVYYIQGSLLSYRDLLRAAVPDAAKVVIMTSIKDDGQEANSHKDDNDDTLAMADYAALMSFLSIEDIRRTTLVQTRSGDKTVKKSRRAHGKQHVTIIDLKQPSNIRFCDPSAPNDPAASLISMSAPAPRTSSSLDLTVEEDCYFMTAAYASGRVFLNSQLDSLICQAFFNPAIIDLTVLLAEGKKSASAATTEHHLMKIKLPRQLTGKSFEEVFLHLLPQGILALGLYRAALAAKSPLPYVYTCPLKTSIVHKDDEVFVLATADITENFHVAG